ncbi:MAG: class I SAM-dependent methyltransferase [Methylobacteriaceae bacterium]|nr:class I SAM-dependent methyltransferase [Methylobacteriaceae bacterium]MBV9703821.1 class I SAM-dependent methyltransferase [Methylobacteriaceae bacterium]
MLSFEERRQVRASMPRVALELRHLAAARLLPDREALLDAMPKHAVVAEVGVATGDFTVEILRRCAVQRLHLIDAWLGERYAPGLEAVRQRFASEIEARIVEINQGLSDEVLSGFPDAHLDWVYIDSDHGFETTLAELTICRRKMRPGGMIAGHDFCTGNVVKPVPYGVIPAVNKFCADFDWGFLYLTVESHGHFSFCIRSL